jgi:hypothetical protein
MLETICSRLLLWSPPLNVTHCQVAHDRHTNFTKSIPYIYIFDRVATYFYASLSSVIFNTCDLFIYYIFWVKYGSKHQLACHTAGLL